VDEVDESKESAFRTCSAGTTADAAGLPLFLLANLRSEGGPLGIASGEAPNTPTSKSDEKDLDLGKVER